MRGFLKRKRKVSLIIVLLLFLTVGGVFLLRSPVLIVTDASFDLLYGSLRFKSKVIKTSLELFRRVIPVVVDERAGSDLVVLIIEAASRSPRAVLFPYRYLEGAGAYKTNHPNVPVLVMEGRSPRSSPPTEVQLTFFRADTATDLYRAGLCAAVLMGQTQGVLFFTEGGLQSQYREAFREGLREQGFLGEPVYVDASMDYYAYSAIGCVVVAGPAAKFLERNLKIPIILFSWTDPDLTPRTVKIAFDDSPLALAVDALRSLEKKPTGAAEGVDSENRASPPAQILVSSQPALFLDRIEEKKDFRKLRSLTKGKFEKK